MDQATAPPTSVREFRARLRALHRRCGEPGNAQLRKAVTGLAVPKLASATLSEFMRDLRPTVLPRQDFVRGFVAGCLVHAKTPADEVVAELARWDEWWASVMSATGQPPITRLSPVQPAAEPPPPRPGRRLPRPAGLAGGGAVAGALAATAIAWVWPWTIFDPSPDLRVEVGMPGGAPEGGCRDRSTDVRDGRDDSAGAVWYRECGDYLEFWTSDHLKDGRCVWAVVHWDNGAVDPTERTCPAGEVTHTRVDRLTDTYRVELVARVTG